MALTNPVGELFLNGAVRSSQSEEKNEEDEARDKGEKAVFVLNLESVSERS
jgi:hypothetical protein